MKFNEHGIAFPDYQKENKFFKNTLHHDKLQWNACQKHIKTFRRCLDFGAHVGITARRYSNKFSSVVSFEPIPSLYECLVYNTKNISNIETYNIAVGDINGTVDIWVNQNNSGSSVVESEATEDLIKSRWLNKERKDFLSMPKITVECRTIDSFHYNDVDFIKIDTEGFNIQPLNGMIETLKKCYPVIQLERGSTGNEESKKLLNKLGYRIVQTIGIDDIFVRKK